MRKSLFGKIVQRKAPYLKVKSIFRGFFLPKNQFYNAKEGEKTILKANIQNAIFNQLRHLLLTLD